MFSPTVTTEHLDDDWGKPQESVPDDAPRWRREHFIPLRKSELVERLSDSSELPTHLRGQFLQFCRLLEETLHHEYHEQLNQLKQAYAPFDPDDDTRALRELGESEEAALWPDVFEKLVALLRRANFHSLTHDDLAMAVGAASDWGVRLRVEFDVFQRLEVFARGDIVGNRVRRRMWNLWRAEQVDVPVFQRLVVIFRLREHRLLESDDVGPVFIKMFKNIPKQDLDMLLPGTRVRMSLIDQGKIILPTLTGIVMAVVKIIKGVFLALGAGIFGVFAVISFIGATFGYGLKSLFGYFETKKKYQLNLTRSLYYQNLDNNAGVLFRILDEAEEQEFREAILAYFLLWRCGNASGWTESELDRQAEAFVKQMTEFDVDFEVHDAIGKLQRLGLIQSVGAKRWVAVPVDTAIQELDRVWDGYFSPDDSSTREAG